MRQAGAVLAVALALAWFQCSRAEVNAPVDRHWPGGFTTVLNIPTENDLNGWQVHLIFDQPVPGILLWDGTAQKINDNEYVISNRSYNGQVSAGDSITLDFNGLTPGVDPELQICASIIGVDPIDICGPTAYVPPGETSTPEPITTTSEPTTATPELTTNTPEPTTNTPEPTTNTPEPTTNTPEPTTNTPEPTTNTPEPTITEPATITSVTTNPAGPFIKKYDQALKLSQLFYYAQRSGRLPEDNPIAWRNDSALNDCVLGGWYDAGDHVKFGFPMAGALNILLWGGEHFKKGYVAADQLDTFYDTVKWGLDYLVSAWNPFRQELVIQVGDGDVDHQFWGRPEDMTMPRPCVTIRPGRPGSDVAAETAAALAAGAIVFHDKGDIAYASKLLSTAESIYQFAKDNRGLYTDSDPITNSWYYTSSNDKDEMCEAGVWLYKATRDEGFLVDAKHEHQSELPVEYDWNNKIAACQLLLYEATKDDTYKDEVSDFLQSWQEGGKRSYSPCEFAWDNATYWGSARHISNVAFAALVAAADGIREAENRKWAAEQINYLLGDNPHDGGCFSYEIGYGDKYPLRPHHRAASCPLPPEPCSEAVNLHTDDPSPHILYGALVGGPIYNDGYNDSRDDYVHNEVALDYNSGFQSALAALSQLVDEDRLPKTENKCPCLREQTIDTAQVPLVG